METRRPALGVKKRAICQVSDSNIASAGKGFVPQSSSEKTDNLSG